jgi:hypothetical protein
MAKPTKILPAVEVELAEAAEWYSRQAPVRGREFVLEVREVLKQIGHVATVSTWAPHVSRRVNARRVRTMRFPYQVIYLERELYFLVVAVASLVTGVHAW